MICQSMIQKDGHSVPMQCTRSDEHEPDEEHRVLFPSHLLNTRGANEPGEIVTVTATWREPKQPKLCGKSSNGGKCLMPRNHAGACGQIALR